MAKKNLNALYTAQTCMWSTPNSLFKDLDSEFNFTTDVCASAENARCAHYYTAEMDGLLQQWAGVCWCNPPYGNRISDWLAKARLHQQDGVTTVFLLPARTDTRWFHAHCLKSNEIRFIKGRLKFGDAKNSAPFPSMLVIFKPQK